MRGPKAKEFFEVYTGGIRKVSRVVIWKPRIAGVFEQLLKLALEEGLKAGTQTASAAFLVGEVALKLLFVISSSRFVTQGFAVLIIYFLFTSMI